MSFCRLFTRNKSSCKSKIRRANYQTHIAKMEAVRLLPFIMSQWLHQVAIVIVINKIIGWSRLGRSWWEHSQGLDSGGSSSCRHQHSLSIRTAFHRIMKRMLMSHFLISINNSKKTIKSRWARKVLPRRARKRLMRRFTYYLNQI